MSLGRSGGSSQGRRAELKSCCKAVLGSLDRIFFGGCFIDTLMKVFCAVGFALDVLAVAGPMTS